MLWTAAEYLRSGHFVVPDDPAIIGIDRALGAAILCGLAAIGLLIPRVRGPVAVSLILGTAYALSAQRLDGGLGGAALLHVPIVLAALFIAWPQLVASRNDD